MLSLTCALWKNLSCCWATDSSSVSKVPLTSPRAQGAGCALNSSSKWPVFSYRVHKGCLISSRSAHFQSRLKKNKNHPQIKETVLKVLNTSVSLNFSFSCVLLLLHKGEFLEHFTQIPYLSVRSGPHILGVKLYSGFLTMDFALIPTNQLQNFWILSISVDPGRQCTAGVCRSKFLLKMREGLEASHPHSSGHRHIIRRETGAGGGNKSLFCSIWGRGESPYS